MKTITARGGSFLVLATLLFCPIVTWAETLPDKFQIDVGAFFVTNADTTISLAATSGPIAAGTIIDFEQDLSLPDSDSVPRIDGYYRFGKKSRVDFSWFKIDRSGTTLTPFDITFGDVTYPAGTAVNSFFDEEVFKVTYGFSFYNVPKAEIGISGGLFIANLKVGINSATVGSESASGTAPLPVVGAYFRYNISPRWRFVGKADFFYLEVGDFQGSLTDIRLNVEHHTWKHAGFGFGFNGIQNNLEADDGEFRGSFKNTISGPQAYVFASFGTAAYQK